MRNKLWWWLIGAAFFVVMIIAGIIRLSSDERPEAFLAKWKSALESSDAKKYEKLWVKRARQRADSGYQATARLLRNKVKLEVDISQERIQPYRVPRYPNRYRIERIPVIVPSLDGRSEHFRDLVIEKGWGIQKRWKIIEDKMEGDVIVEIPSVPDLEEPDPTNPSALEGQSDSPVAPVVRTWKTALESQNVRAYTVLWDKSARKEQASNFQRATDMMSQTHTVDITNAVYEAVISRKNRHIVSGLRVTLRVGDEPIETHDRMLTIEKKGFFRRKWRVVNDQIGEASDPIALAPTEPSAADTISGEESGGTFDGNAPIDTHLKVRQILGKWQASWEGKDLETYMSIYADRARITRVTVRDGVESSVDLTKKQLESKMKKLNSLYGDIQVSISNLQVNGDRAVADVTFLQKFAGTSPRGTRPAYSDYGTKTLNLMVDPSDGHWRIYAEKWSRYEDVPEYPKM